MDWYINESNQDLLWNTIHRVPSVSLVPLFIRETTFKNIIECYYNGVPKHQFLDLSQKKEINRNTVSVFLTKIQSHVTTTIPNSVVVNPMTHKMFESKQDKSQREFTERQQMYEQMTAKPDIPSADIFREKVDTDDETIRNMDDLIKQYQLEREKDMQLLSPPNENIIFSGDKSRPKVSFTNDPVIIPSFVVLEETVLQNIEELHSISETHLREDKYTLKDMRDQLSQCIEIIQDISLNHSLPNDSLFSGLQEKIYIVRNFIDEYVR
jgi:hypothetical protein